MPASSDQIIAELDRLLEPQRFEDYGPNGLQVPGPPSVSRIATGVSAHAELFERAAAERAQLLIVHHGLFWGPGFRVIDSALKRRLHRHELLGAQRKEHQLGAMRTRYPLFSGRACNTNTGISRPAIAAAPLASG